jgi:hypothetical protein
MNLNSLRSRATGLATWWLRRPIPSTFPEISEDKREDIKSKLQAGDVLMSCSTERANLAHFAHWAAGASYSHAAIYDGKGSVVETAAEGVTINPVDKFLQGASKFTVVRPSYESEQAAAQVVVEAKKLKGVPFDFKFDSSDNSALSCSELIEVAMKKVDPSMEVPDRTILGHLTTVADDFANMEGARVIVDGDSHYWKNLRHQWPTYVASAVGAGLGAIVGGPLGAGVGSILGYEGSIWISKALD